MINADADARLKSRDSTEAALEVVHSLTQRPAANKKLSRSPPVVDI
jgi:hypothetical protein